MLLAQANHQLWIHPRHKDAFFIALEEHQTVQPGHLPLQASLGSVHVSTTVFIHCLNVSGCDTIRLMAHGQKTPLEARFISYEPAQVDHRWAEHNEWDIGPSFTAPHVRLFHSSQGRRHGLQHYPMLVPGSGNFGSVNIKGIHRGRYFSIKIYPRLVHVIKSFNSRLQGSVPRTLQGVRNQVGSASRMGSQPDQQESDCPWGIQNRGHRSSQKSEGRASISFSYQFPETGILAQDCGWTVCPSRVDRSTCFQRWPSRKRQLGSQPSSSSQYVCWCCFRQTQQAAGPSHYRHPQCSWLERGYQKTIKVIGSRSLAAFNSIIRSGGNLP
jgi:hypothetical protein